MTDDQIKLLVLGAAGVIVAGVILLVILPTKIVSVKVVLPPAAAQAHR